MNTTMTWEEICNDPGLKDLPYKIEQDRYGRIVMSPAKSSHSGFQGEAARRLGALLPEWAILVECGIDTSEGVKVPDVAAMRRERFRLHKSSISLPEAPEICVEVLSPANSPEEMEEKRRLYAGAGCREFWTCSEDGGMEFFEASTGRRLSASLLCPSFPAQLDA